MGLFNKNPEASNDRREEWSRKKHDKAREKLLKKGVDLDGCLLLDDSIDDGSYEYLLIFQDRVEYISMTVIGRLGKGVEIIPISQISSVSTKKKLGVFEIVQITSSGRVIEFKSDPYNAPKLKSKILELKNATTTETSDSHLPDPSEQLVKLSDLHKAGIITDEEFSAKKAELLKRIWLKNSRSCATSDLLDSVHNCRPPIHLLSVSQFQSPVHI